MERVKYAAQLLNLLVKTAYFLALAETALVDATLAARFRKDLGKRPGDTKLFAETCRLYEATVGVSPNVSAAVLEIVAVTKRDQCKHLVDARDRFHHPAFDDQRLVKLGDKYFPGIIDGFRDGLQRVEFVAVESCRLIAGQWKVKAFILMGYDIDFRSKEFETTAPIEQFPAWEVLALSPRRKQPIPLTSYFAAKKNADRVVDVGVFDHEEKGGDRVFAYTRQVSEVQQIGGGVEKAVD